MNETYKVQVFWGPRQETAKACAVRFGRMIEGLAAVHPACAQWNKQGHSRTAANRPFCAMPPQVNELERILERGKFYKDEPREPMVDLGYSVSAWNGLDGAKSMSFRVHCGAWSRHARVANQVEITFRRAVAENADLVSAPLLTKALLTLVLAWEPDWGSVSVGRYLQRMMAVPGEQVPSFRSGWATYLAPFHAEKISTPLGVIVEQLNDGGLVLISTRELFSMDNPDHVAAADAIQAALAPIQVERLGPSGRTP